MAPNSAKEAFTGVLNENDADTIDGALATDIVPLKGAEKRKVEIVWFNIIVFIYLAGASLYGLFLFVTLQYKWQTYLWTIFTVYMCAFGITVGAHRLWSHRSYKAKLPLRLILLFFSTMAFQNSIYEWSRDHRVHHKFTETDADPHNAMRGFFFSHVGWLLCKKHPAVKEKGKTIDLSDLEADPWIMWQHKYYGILMPLICFILPAVLPVALWGESFSVAWHASVFRWFFLANGTWCINSVCHLFGTKPYDKSNNPAENAQISWFTVGECWHNYHHVFPWDYKAAEFGGSRHNFSAAFIEFFAKLGWAYDMKTVSPNVIEKRVQRTGDGSHPVWGLGEKDFSHPIWGWGDKDQTLEQKKSAVILNKEL
ncbi:acyl-CoA Delta-9 desaturase-like [Musca autumnalis]|uniref:acyl-CoA Delta-9 desaturase-like n=1 Tax=Musca autumnalis TaxID=221902 RepID=UPI003CEBD634